MTQYLEHLDPWDHIRTTHFSTTYSRIKSTLVSIPGIDYITCDAYTGRGVVPLIVKSADAFAAYGKPGLVTEYGGTPFAATPARLRADLHGGIWATYMTHTAGTPLLWWFQFLEADNLYWNFKALAAYHQGEDRRGKGLIPIASTPRRENEPPGVAFVNGHHDLSALGLRNPQMAYLWVYSRSAMEKMPAEGQEPVFENITLQIRGMASSAFRVEVWDTYKGSRIASLELAASDGKLTVPLPKFRNDVALKIKPAG
jgi:hypothetical protein